MVSTAAGGGCINTIFRFLFSACKIRQTFSIFEGYKSTLYLIDNNISTLTTFYQNNSLKKRS